MLLQLSGVCFAQLIEPEAGNGGYEGGPELADWILTHNIPAVQFKGV